MANVEMERACEMWRGMWPQKEEPTIEDYREAYDRFLEQFPVPEDVTVEKVDAGGVPSLWVSTPGVSQSRTILWLHGGGYVIGNAWHYREITSHLGRAADARALVVDYRLAPEHPFPAAVDDAVAAYRWLLAQGTSPQSIVIGGDSAGGGLALATVLALKDAGEPLPAAVATMSPWVDLECSAETFTTKAEFDPVVSQEAVLGMAGMYLAGQDARAPLASPLFGDLKGLPPLLIHVGTRETLLDDSLHLADRARSAGVDVTLEMVDEAPHVFQLFSSILPEGRGSVEGIAQFIRKHVAA